MTGKELRIEESDFLAKKLKSNQTDSFILHDFCALCRGEYVSYSYVPKTAICKLTTKNNPYFYLAPIKEEEVTKEPPVHIYHDILTEGEIEFMRNHISSRLKVTRRSVYRGSFSHTDVMTVKRTMERGFATDHEHQLLHKLSKKTGKVVQLEVTKPDKEIAAGVELVESEPWQIGLYGAGGHFNPHLDSFVSKTEDLHVFGPNGVWVGNRIATIMFYLSDVIGGSLVFPNLGVGVTPSKGSAVLWYNLDRFGKVDPMTFHGGCPTMLGIKWVSNKWINQGAQIWKRSCAIKNQ